jgi:hypothetical protein
MFNTHKKNLKISVGEGEQDPGAVHYPATHLSTHPIKPRYSTEVSAVSYDRVSTISTSEQDLSLRSINSITTPRSFFRLSGDPAAPASPSAVREGQQFAAL